MATDLSWPGVMGGDKAWKQRKRSHARKSLMLFEDMRYTSAEDAQAAAERLKKEKAKDKA